MKNVFLTLVIVVSVFFIACNDAATDNTIATKDSTAYDAENVKEYIKKEGAAFEEEVKRGDSNAIAAHYSSDALIMPSNSEVVKGNDIAGFWGSAIRNFGIKELKLDITDVTGDGNVVAETGNYEMFGADNKSLDKGKYIVVWKKEDGKWKIYRDIFNSNLPPAGSK